nr:ankyrin repeat domain-containing protein 26-like isoform X2 [Microcebus murinus]
MTFVLLKYSGMEIDSHMSLKVTVINYHFIDVMSTLGSEEEDIESSFHLESSSESLSQKELSFSSGTASQTDKEIVNLQVGDLSAEPDILLTSEEEQEKLEASESSQSQVGKERKNHKSNEIEVSKNLYNSDDDSDDDRLIQQRKVGKTDNQQFAKKENEELDRPAKKISKKKNKVKNLMHSMKDLDDLSWSPEMASGDCELPSFHYKTVMSLIKQHEICCKDSVSLSGIQNEVFSCLRLIELQKNHCQQLTVKKKTLENMVSVLKKKLSETKEIKSQLEHQNVKWEGELYSLRFTLKQEEEKRRNAEILYEKMREKLMEKEQYTKETEMKHQLRQTPHDTELKTIRNYSNQISCSHEKEKDMLHENPMWQDETARLRLEIDLIKKENQKKEKKYLEDLELLQERNDDIQNALKQKEKLLTQYSGDLCILRAENQLLGSRLEKEKQNKERLSTEVESYRSRLTTTIRDRDENVTIKKDLELNFHSAAGDWCCLQKNLNLQVTYLCQQLSKADSKSDSLEVELDHTRQALKEKTLVLQTVQRDLSQSQCQKKEIEQMYENKRTEMNKYIAKQKCIKEKLSQLQNENMLLRQQLKTAHDQADIREKTMTDIQDQFHNIVIKCQDESKKQSLLLAEKNKELIKECNNLKERQYECLKEKAETEAVVRQLQQELADTVQNLSRSKTSLHIMSHCQDEAAQDSKKILNQITSQLEEAQDQLKQTTRHAEKMQDDMKKLKIKNSKLKVIIRQQVDKLKQHEKNLLSARATQTSCQEDLQHTGTTETMTELSSSHSKSKLSTVETSQEDDDKTIIGKYKPRYLKELKDRKLLSNELSIAHDTLVEVKTKLLEEKQKSRSLSASLTATPCVENIKESLVSTENLPQGKTVIPASSPEDFE